MTVVNLSYAACGFLGIYYPVAAGGFLHHGGKLLTYLRASARALALVTEVMVTELREAMEEILPANAHCLASNRLYISITHSCNGKNLLVSRFTSKEDLVKFSMENLKRMNQALFPLLTSILQSLCE